MICTVASTEASINASHNLTLNNDTWDVGEVDVNWFSAIETILYTKVILVICVVGILGNILCLVILTRKSLTGSMDRMEKSAHMGLVALAISDLLFCITALPHSLLDLQQFEHSSLDFRLVYKIANNGLVNTFIMSSTWLTVLIAMCRYLAIVFPIKGRQLLGITFTGISIAMVFIICIIFNLPRFFTYKYHSILCDEGWPAYYVLPEETSIASGPLYLWLYFIVCIFMPLVLLAFCNTYLIRALHSSHKMRRQHCRSHDISVKRKNTLTLTLIIIVVCYIVLVTPAELVNFTKSTIISKPDFIHSDKYNLATAICNTLQALNFACNFGLYCFINTHFRQTLKLLCGSKRNQHNAFPLTDTRLQEGYTSTTSVYHYHTVNNVNSVVGTKI